MSANGIGVAILVLIAILRIAICIAASIYDYEGHKVPRGRRLPRFLSTFPWP